MPDPRSLQAVDAEIFAAIAGERDASELRASS